MDRFDYGWDPHEREEAVWRDPTSRTQIYVGDNTDVVPLDEQGVLTDREDDTADPHYVPGRRRAEEVDPDQSDIEDQFLSRVRQPSQSPPSTSTRTVHLAEEGAVRQALQRGNQLLLHLRVLLHPAHQQDLATRRFPKVFDILLLCLHRQV